MGDVPRFSGTNENPGQSRGLCESTKGERPLGLFLVRQHRYVHFLQRALLRERDATIG
jgi:hypothetical protein